MATWSLNEAERKMSEVIERAESEGPQIILRHGRPVGAVIRIEDLEDLERLKRAGRRALAIEEPSEAEVAEIATARMPAEHDHRNAHTSARKPGRLTGKVQVGREVLEPLPEEELARWEGR